MRPPLWMSTITSASGKSFVESQCASCSSGGPSGEPGNERLRLAPDGQRRVYSRDASGERQGSTITRPLTCSGRNSRARLSAATWPSGSSPCTPPSTTTVGPSPRATDTIGSQSVDEPLRFDERGRRSVPGCFPGASRSSVQWKGEALNEL